MKDMFLNIYAVAKLDANHEFIQYNLPFVAMNDDIAKKMIIDSLKDVKEEDGYFDKYYLCCLAEFNPFDGECAINGFEFYDPIDCVTNIIKLNEKETNDVE